MNDPAHIRGLLFPVLAVTLFSPTAFSRPTQSEMAPIALNLTEGEDVRFTRLSTPEGLSQSRVEHILQDDQGFMWFGTENGLNRYDGYTFKVFRHNSAPTSLSGVTISALFKDRAGMIWIGVDQSLDRFDPATETFTHYRPDQNVGAIFSIFQDSVGRIWFATKHGLVSMDQVTGQFTYYRHDPSDPSSLSSDDLRFAMQDRSGILWVVSEAGLDTLDPRTNRISHFNQFKQAEKAFWPDTQLYEDRTGLLWMISTSGTEFTTIDRNTRAISRYSFYKQEHPSLIKSGILSIHEDNDGVLWLGTGGNGLVRFDRKTLSCVQYRSKPGVSSSLSNNFVFSLFEDREGTMWAGTGGGGVSHFQRKPLPFRVYQHDPANQNSLNQNYVLSAHEDSQGILWIGNDKVLNRLDRATGRYTVYRHNPDDPGSISMASVTSVVEENGRFLWFGTYGGGLNRFDRRTQRFKSYRSGAASDSLSSDLVFTLFLDRDGILWIGTDDGLNRFDPQSERFTRFRQNPPSPTGHIIQDRQGLLWLGTIGGGLRSFDPRSGQFTAYTHNDTIQMGLSDDHVNALLIDRSDILWVGTQNGLDKFDLRTRTFAGSYGERDGMADDAVQGIQKDDRDNLWISTNKGLSRFQPRTGRFTCFYGSDGLAGNDFSVLFPVSFKSPSGEMFFGGVDGLTSFYPDKVDEVGNSYVPPVVLTEFRINNLPVSVGGDSPLTKAISHQQNLILSYKEKIVSLEFSALSFVNPARNRYRYKLEGLENKWFESGSDRRFVSYTTLPPGDYVFHVQGSNDLGVWNEKGASIHIHVSPPWWNALWFRMVFGVLLLFAASIGYKYRLNLVSRQLSLRFEERLSERTRIAQELHDTLLQGFMSASMHVHVAADRLPADSQVKPTLTRALQLMGQVIDEGRNSVRGLRASRNLSLDLEQAFVGIQQELEPENAHGARIGFRVIAEGQQRPLHPLLRDEVYRIGREALTNAFRHSRANQIEVELKYTSNQLRLVVRDDGCGIDQSILLTGREGHWGLPGMRERAERIGGRLQVFSSASAGTEVELLIPSRIAFQDERRGLRWLRKNGRSGQPHQPPPIQNGRSS
jgi:ligand-binding sensor domain-containing protein